MYIGSRDDLIMHVCIGFKCVFRCSFNLNRKIRRKEEKKRVSLSKYLIHVGTTFMCVYIDVCPHLRPILSICMCVCVTSAADYVEKNRISMSPRAQTTIYCNNV